MDIYFSGDGYSNALLCEYIRDICVLRSFFYERAKKDKGVPYHKAKKYMLDSGAFTFLKKNCTVDWDRYVCELAEYINTYDIQHFFELDIDSIIGLDAVEKLRTKLECRTGKQAIPVWHYNRGKQYYLDMCKNYPYVALGGIVSKDIPLKEYQKAFPYFIRTAHEHGAKIHGLGYTRVANLKLYRFDSVDSSSWWGGSIGGYLHIFSTASGTFRQVSRDGCRIKTVPVAKHNLSEWVKFSKYAEKYL